MTVQEQCELGQRLLMETCYLDAIETLTAAEAEAWKSRDFDTLSRLYMPLQEARRQARQRCGEGMVNLGLLADESGTLPAPDQILKAFPHGQLIVAGWGSIAPALAVRKLAREQKLYVETFLGAVFPVLGGGRVLAIVPSEGVQLPAPVPVPVDVLLKKLPAHCLVHRADDFEAAPRLGNTQTFALVSDLWEQLHRPFLAAADMQGDPIRKMEGYRQTIQVDSACELAHQNLSAVANNLARIAQ